MDERRDDEPVRPAVAGGQRCQRARGSGHGLPDRHADVTQTEVECHHEVSRHWYGRLAPRAAATTQRSR